MADYDARVAALIADYLKRATGPTAPVTVKRAFANIQAYRQRHCANDSVTVAAEHYLFTRYLTSSHLLAGTGYFVLSPFVNLGYDALKEIKKAVGSDLTVTDCPSSETHCYIRMWSVRGAKDGYGDRGETVAEPPEASATAMMLACWPLDEPSF